MVKNSMFDDKEKMAKAIGSISDIYGIKCDIDMTKVAGAMGNINMLVSSALAYTIFNAKLSDNIKAEMLALLDIIDPDLIQDLYDYIDACNDDLEEDDKDVE